MAVPRTDAATPHSPVPMRLPLRAAATAALLVLAALPAAAQSWPSRAADSAQALAAFRENLASIHRRDRAAYLSTYLQSPRLARTGPGGVQWGYAGLAAGNPDAWPDTLVATHAEVVPVAPGVVYGTYRYRVVQGGSARGVSERVLVKQPDGTWRIAVTTAFAAPGNAPVPPVALTGATVIDGTGAPPRAGATVVIRDGRIACAGACEVPADAHVIDARGRFIVPGLVDAHVHYSQTGWVDGRPDALDLRERFPYERTVAELEAHPERFYRSQLCAGVTATFDVGGYPWTWGLRRAAEADNGAPRLAVAGPLLSALDHWVNTPNARQFVFMGSDSATRAGARAAIAHGTDAVKVWYIVEPNSPDTTMWKARLRIAAEEARRADVPLIVHATELWSAKDALRAGARVLVHSVEDAEVDDEFLRLAREAGVTYVPTLTVREGYVQVYERRFRPETHDMACVDPETRRKAFLTDSLPGGITEAQSRAVRARFAAEDARMAANLRRVHAAGIPVAMGTDAGNPLTLHGASVFQEIEAMAAAGLTPMEVLVASTRNGARAMGRTDFGTIEPGMWADLVVLDADPLADVRHLRRVRLVVRGGEVWTRDELEYR